MRVASSFVISFASRGKGEKSRNRKDNDNSCIRFFLFFIFSRREIGKVFEVRAFASCLFCVCFLAFWNGNDQRHLAASINLHLSFKLESAFREHYRFLRNLWAFEYRLLLFFFSLRIRVSYETESQVLNNPFQIQHDSLSSLLYIYFTFFIVVLVGHTTRFGLGA